MPQISSQKEKFGLLFFALIFFVGLGILGTNFYLKNTQIAPGYGGSLTVAVIGSPRFLNPVLSQLNNTDRDLTPVFFSSLFKYNNSGNLVPELAERYEISDDGKNYDIFLRQNVSWQDNKNLTADDVIFTLKTIQDQQYQSPLRALWQGTGYEKIDDYAVRFKLKNAYAPFLHTLTFGILPKHSWESISPAQFGLNELNLKPIGSGPYKFSRLSKDKDGYVRSLEVDSFDKYFGGRPFISKIIFEFFDSEEEAINAFKREEIDILSFVSPSDKKEIESKNLNLKIYSLKLPRYFAIFFNQEQNPVLANKVVREALAYAIDKESLIKEVLGGAGEIVNTPILSGMTGFSNDAKIYDFDLEKAKTLLLNNGWKISTTSAATSSEVNLEILQKDGKNLEITLTTNDWPDLVASAQFIQKQWQALDIKINLDVKDSTKIQNEAIKPRQYQALLFGEVLGVEPDPFSFWHSSQKKDPGLNLSLYENADADKLLVDARQDMNNETRAQKYREFSNLVANDLSTIFLFSPDYLLAARKDIKGIFFENINSSSSYFSQINKWYLNTVRAWK